jgi:hypothetical protein
MAEPGVECGKQAEPPSQMEASGHLHVFHNH